MLTNLKLIHSLFRCFSCKSLPPTNAKTSSLFLHVARFCARRRDRGVSRTSAVSEARRWLLRALLFASLRSRASSLREASMAQKHVPLLENFELSMSRLQLYVCAQRAVNPPGLAGPICKYTVYTRGQITSLDTYIYREIPCQLYDQVGSLPLAQKTCMCGFAHDCGCVVNGNSAILQLLNLRWVFRQGQQ